MSRLHVAQELQGLALSSLPARQGTLAEKRANEMNDHADRISGYQTISW